MFGAIARAIFGSSNDRILKGMNRLVLAVNAKEPEVKALDDAALAARTVWLRDRLEKGETLDDLRPFDPAEVARAIAGLERLK